MPSTNRAAGVTTSPFGTSLRMERGGSERRYRCERAQLPPTTSHVTTRVTTPATRSSNAGARVAAYSHVTPDLYGVCSYQDARDLLETAPRDRPRDREREGGREGEREAEDGAA
eukprot:2367981-Rhodomonas_salina.1